MTPHGEDIHSGNPVEIFGDVRVVGGKLRVCAEENPGLQQDVIVKDVVGDQQGCVYFEDASEPVDSVDNVYGLMIQPVENIFTN